MWSSEWKQVPWKGEWLVVEVGKDMAFIVKRHWRRGFQWGGTPATSFCFLLQESVVRCGKELVEPCQVWANPIKVIEHRARGREVYKAEVGAYITLSWVLAAAICIAVTFTFSFDDWGGCEPQSENSFCGWVCVHLYRICMIYVKNEDSL